MGFVMFGGIIVVLAGEVSKQCGIHVADAVAGRLQEGQNNVTRETLTASLLATQHTTGVFDAARLIRDRIRSMGKLTPAARRTPVDGRV
jgi:hypothetical protein